MLDDNQKLIYLDHAATSYPKPVEVYEAHDRYFRSAGNPGRGAHNLALDSARKIFAARQSVAEFLGVENSEQIIFTPGCTYSINMVLRGLNLKARDCIVTGPLEHNAVMRTLQELQEEIDVQVVVLPYADRGIIDSATLSAAIDEAKPALCVLSDASNVTGERIDLKSIADCCAARNVPLLIDAAQTAGLEEGGLRHEGISYWAASGHKGLLGCPGTGVLFVRDKNSVAPFVFGGTGSNSESFDMPHSLPDRLEPGTLAGSAIAALGAGVEFIQKAGAQTHAFHEHELANAFREWCFSKSWIKVSGLSYREKRLPSILEAVPVVSFQMRQLTPDRVADILNSRFQIAVRPGLHCAPSAHQKLGSVDLGLVRVSFGYFNTVDDVRYLSQALEFIADERS